LSLGHAINIPRMLLFNEENGDIQRNSRLNKIWNNIFYQYVIIK
jgi:hypothetical protein